MDFNDYYMHMHLGIKPPSNDEPEEPEEEQASTSPPPDEDSIPNDIFAFVQPAPRPPTQETIPNDIVAFVQPTPQPVSTYSNTGGISLPPPPVRPPGSKPSNTGGISLPPPPRRDPRLDDSRTGRPTDDGDGDRTRPGRIVEELQDERPDYSDDLTQAVGAAYGDVNDIYFQLYYGQSAVRMNDFAESGLDDESDERAEERILRRVERVRRETMTDLADDRWESIVAIDTKTGEKVFWRYGSRNYTFLQEEQRKMVEGREIALIHNHPNNTAASQADLEGAFWLGAKSLTVVTPSGYRYVYIRGTHEMELAAVINDPNYVANPSWREDVESSTAFWTQTLAEKGNQPEWVMEQEEPFWWQQDYIVVPYKGNETIEEVSARLISPRPVKFPNDDPYYNQLYQRHLIESEEIPRLLRELNPLNSGTDAVNIPVPGWYLAAEYGGFVHDGRTLGIPLLSPHLLRDWWVSLSATEQKIEMALTATANTRPGSANFDNTRSFDSVMSWIARNDETIGANAINGLPRELLELVMASELLFDYGSIDHWQDVGIRYNVVPDERAWNSVGAANVHYATLFEAYYYTRDRLPEGVEHSWHSIPNAPDLSIVEQLIPDDSALQAHTRKIYTQDRLPKDGFHGLSLEQQERVRFLLFEETYTRELKKHPELRRQIAQLLVTDEGSIHAASMVTRMYMDEYIRTNWEDPQDILQIAANLSPEDMARIWGRFRSALELFETHPATNGRMGPNALLALPIAEYLMQDQ